jgi:phosphate transport system permease protein
VAADILAGGRESEIRARDWSSVLGQWSTGLATGIILLILALVAGVIVWLGAPHLSWRLVSSGSSSEMFDVSRAGILPMIIGTSARVILMTFLVLPVGVLTAIYLAEYAPGGSLMTRVIRSAVDNLAGVPSIVFGLFGAGFFVQFLGRNMDVVFHGEKGGLLWGQPSLLWASATLAVMTLPVMIVATEEALRGVPRGMREASLALGATRLETIRRIILPQAVPGILTGAILAVSRAAGEVAPILFTGAAYYISDVPRHLHDQFMDLGYHVFILSTQSPNVDRTAPILFATVLVLLLLTFLLNATAVVLRARLIRRKHAIY